MPCVEGAGVRLRVGVVQDDMLMVWEDEGRGGWRVGGEWGGSGVWCGVGDAGTDEYVVECRSESTL